MEVIIEIDGKKETIEIVGWAEIVLIRLTKKDKITQQKALAKMVELGAVNTPRFHT